MSISGIQGLATHQLHWQNAQAQIQMAAQSAAQTQVQQQQQVAKAKSGNNPLGAEPGKGQYVNKLA